MKKNLIVAAVALAASANVSAAVLSPLDAGGLGEAVFSIWDPTTNQSYAQDLGTTWQTFHDNLGNTSYSASFTVDASVYGAALGGSDTANLIWNVSVADSQKNDFSNFGDFGVIATSSLGNVINTAALGAAIQTSDQYATTLNSLSSNADTALNEAIFGTVLNGGYAGAESTWGTSWNTNGSTNNSAAFGTDLDFYYWQDIGISTDTQVTKAVGSWSFDGTTLSYAAPSAVPVPAAVWLFGSGLIGLVGVARRKTANA